MLYVRTEQRPGAEAPQHFFVAVKDRVVLERWTPEGQGVPPSLSLSLDPDSQSRADRLADGLAQANAKVSALSAALKRAVLLLPEEPAADLRRIYNETFKRLYGEAA